MAATGYTPISIYYSSTAGNTPTAGNLVAGELAINTADGKLFYKDSAGVVQVIGTKGGVGSSTTTQVLYNSSGLVVGSANMTFNGTSLTLANDASISGLTVGKGGGNQSDNAVLGAGALANSLNTGNYNVALGSATLGVNTSGQQSFGGGWRSLWSNTTGSYNVALGHQSMYLNTTGSNNTALGFTAMISNTTGASNTAIGYNALNSNTTASNNTAVGYQAGYSNTTGNRLVAVGYQSGYSSNTNVACTFVGYVAGNACTGTGNTFVGDNAGYLASSGTFNTFVGQGSGADMTTGGKNSILGKYSGLQTIPFIGGTLDIRTSSNSVVLSDGDANPYIWHTSAAFYVPSVYFNTTAVSSNVCVASNGGISRATSALKYKQDVRDLPFIDINKFRPVVYKSKCENDDQTTDHFGFIADEVDAAGIKELVQYGENGEVEGFSYDRLTAVLVKTIQDLQKRIEILENK